MCYPKLVLFDSIEEYRERFFSIYCSDPIETFDAIHVRFRRAQFEHCFFESSNRDGIKDQFSQARAERIDWIFHALKDSKAEIFVGWDKRKKRHDSWRRVVLVCGNYVVVIRLTGIHKADFVTAFIADTPSSLESIKSSPSWPFTP